jgi:hypothetical protein
LTRERVTLCYMETKAIEEELKQRLIEHINALTEANITKRYALKSYYLGRINGADTVGKLQSLAVEMFELAK